MPATTISGPIGTTKYYGVKPQTPYDYYLNGQGGYGTPPAGATAATSKKQVEIDAPLRPLPENLGLTLSGQKYTGATPYTTTPVIPNGQRLPGSSNANDVSGNFLGPEPVKAGAGTLPEGFSYSIGNDMWNMSSPAGNNITSGVASPTTTFNNTPTVPTAPNTGTGTYSPDMSFLNPASGTAGTKRKTGMNKYFNQSWFGGKQLA